MTAIPADFPWRAGMRILPNADGGFRYARILIMDDGVTVCTAVEQRVGLSRHVGPWIEAWNEHAPNDQDVPDLTDPATVGALLGAVREAYGDPNAYVMFARSIAAWVFCAHTYDPIESYIGEADVIIAAWNARPKASA